jgi:hypothetical protein
MLFAEIMVVSSEYHTKPVSIFCGQNVELLIVKAGGACGFNWAVKG